MNILASFMLACALAVPALAPAAAQQPTVEDRLAMIDAATAIAAGADRHDWPRVRAAFGDRVTLDYTSLWGGEPTTQAADEVVAAWSSFLPGFDTTQHLVANHTVLEIDGDSARMEADFQATHRIEEEIWVLQGRYAYDLAKVGGTWKVRGMVMTSTGETGDRGLVEQAQAQAAKTD